MASAESFVLELGRALHALGSASYRVEDAMDAVCRRFGLRGRFFATPTAIFASIAPPNAEPHVVLLRVRPGDDDLGKLTALYEARDRVMRGETDADAGLRAIAAVLAAPPTRSRGLSVPAWSLAAAASAGFLGGGGEECAVAGAIGLLVAAFGWFAHRRPRLHRIFEAFACAIAAFAAHAAARWIPIDRGTVIVASIVPLLPGLSFTTALAELAIQHLASGSARLLGALTVLLTMAVGIGIGGRAGAVAFGELPDLQATPLPAWGIAIALPGLALAYAVLLRAAWAQVPWVFAAVAISFLGSRLGTELLVPRLGAFLGAFAVVLASNLYSRWRRRPAAVMRTPGLTLLVPGSLGLRGLSKALEGGFADGSEFAFRMVLVGGAIVAGMLVAGALLPPPLDVEPDVDGEGRASG